MAKQIDQIKMNFQGVIKAYIDDKLVLEQENKIMRKHIPAIIEAISNDDYINEMGAGNYGTTESTDLTEMTSVTEDSASAIFSNIDDTVHQHPYETVNDSTGQIIKHEGIGVVTFISNFSSGQTAIDGNDGPVEELALKTKKDRLFARSVIDPGIPKPNNTTITFKWSIFYGIN